MDAWERLTSGSMLTAGDVWDHLTNQGGGTDQIIYVNGGLEAVMENTQLSASRPPSDLQATLTDLGELSATVHEITLAGTVTAATLSGTITESELSGVIE